MSGGFYVCRHGFCMGEDSGLLMVKWVRNMGLSDCFFFCLLKLLFFGYDESFMFIVEFYRI